MRGFPPLQLVLVLLGFCLLAVPLWRLTSTPAAAPAPLRPPADSPGTERKARLNVRCAHTPDKIELYTDKGPLAVWEKEADWPQSAAFLLDPSLNAEIGVSARWPEGTPSTAVTAELCPEGAEARSQTLWSDGNTLEDVFTFSPVTPGPRS